MSINYKYLHNKYSKCMDIYITYVYYTIHIRHVIYVKYVYYIYNHIYTHTFEMKIDINQITNILIIIK